VWWGGGVWWCGCGCVVCVGECVFGWGVGGLWPPEKFLDLRPSEIISDAIVTLGVRYLLATVNAPLNAY